ncbi:hypothetical protein D3C75_784130 [compost metagenome]
MGLNNIQNMLRVLIADQAAGDFGMGFLRDNGLAAFTLEPAVDTVQFEGWPGTDTLYEAEAFFPIQLLQTKTCSDFVFIHTLLGKFFTQQRG